MSFLQKKYLQQGKSLSSKKGKIKAIYCYAAQHYYMRLLQMKDVVIMHAAKEAEFKYCWEFFIPSF